MTKLTIAIATYNSMKILPKIVDAIKRQNINHTEVELLLVDGGSTDQTKTYGQQIGARVIDNPDTDPVSAKHLALLEANSPILMYLDHDEELESSFALKDVVEAFEMDSHVVAAVHGGYTTPSTSPDINYYFNEFGDPFSCYIYNQSKQFGRFEASLVNYWKMLSDHGKIKIFEPRERKACALLLELVAMGSVIRRSAFLEHISSLKNNKWEIPHLYYSSLKFPSVRFAMIANSSIAHHSLDSAKIFKKKIEWRVLNNVHKKSEIGQSGFQGRQLYSREVFFKKLFYIPYVYLFFPVLFHTLYLVASRGRKTYFNHLGFSYFTTNTIVKNILMKLLSIQPKNSNYDGSLAKKTN